MLTIPANLASFRLYKHCIHQTLQAGTALNHFLYKREIFIQVLAGFRKVTSAKVLWCTVKWMPGMWKVKMWLAANAQKAPGILIPPF